MEIVRTSVCLALAAGPLVAAAQALPAPALARATALAERSAQALAPAGARVVALPGAPDPRLRLAPCEEVEASWPAGARAWGRTRVALRCTRGPKPWTVTLPMTVTVLAPAPVLAAPLPAGTVLEAQHLAEATVDWSAAPQVPVARAEDLLGRTLAHSLAGGQPLHAADLKPRQWFAAGETVRIVAAGSGYEVTSEGQALTAGVEGQVARVRTEAGRVVVGQPAGERRLEVAL
ncbi:MAG: flagellar basal body P-ring formation chaperone FlgA [Rubrivivax sp.]